MNKAKSMIVKIDNNDLITETSKLYFKPFKKDDFELLNKIRGSEQVMQYNCGARTVEATRKELLNEIDHQKEFGFSKWAVFLKENNEFIGRAGLSVMETGEVEVGYGFLPDYWSKGYATEALNAVLKWGFTNIPISEIIAFTHQDNIASIRVLEKCGMKFYKQSQFKGQPFKFYYKRVDGFFIKQGKALTEEQLVYIENSFSKIADSKHGLPPVESFSISLTDQNQNLRATVYGSIYYGCMYIDTIYVDEALRNKGYGTELMQKAERLALEKDCTFITLNTMNWEARGFYEKLGYVLEFERKGYMKGSSMFLLRKDFKP